MDLVNDVEDDLAVVQEVTLVSVEPAAVIV